MRKLGASWKVYQGWMGCDPFDRLALALGEVTVNNKYEMSTSDDPIFRRMGPATRREPSPSALALTLLRPVFSNDHRNLLARCDVVTGPEFRRVFIEVEPNAEVGELAGKVVVTTAHIIKPKGVCGGRASMTKLHHGT